MAERKLAETVREMFTGLLFLLKSGLCSLKIVVISVFLRPFEKFPIHILISHNIELHIFYAFLRNFGVILLNAPIF